jgi:Na+/glutamate symporter
MKVWKILIIILVVLVGWIMNLVKLCKCDFKAPYKTEIIRGIAIPVFPMGAVVGFISIGEEEVKKVSTE